MVKQKVLLAINNVPLENYMINMLDDEFEFSKAVSYRAAILPGIEKSKPNIIVIVEELQGKENMTKLIYDIFKKYPNIRIVFIANERLPGDKLLNTLINYRVYDLIIGDEINANKIIHAIRVPNTYKDISYLHAVELVDETKGDVLFEAPDSAPPRERIVEVIKEVYVDTSTKNTLQKDEYVQQTSEHENTNENMYEIIGSDRNGNEVAVKDVLPNGYFFYDGYFFNKLNNQDYYYYYEGYFFDKSNEPFANYNGKLVKYEDYVRLLNETAKQDEVEEDEFVIESSYEKEIKEHQKQQELEAERERTRQKEAEIQSQRVRQEMERQKRDAEETERLRRLDEERRYQERLAREEEVKLENKKRKEQESRKMQEQLSKQEPTITMGKSRTNAHVPKEEEKERNNRFMSMFGGRTQNQMMQAVSNSNKKLITFVSSKSGAGASTIAFNTATTLANQNYKVLYVEYNYKSPATTFWYDVGYTRKGIDTALEGLKNSSLVEIEDAIISMENLRRQKIEGSPYKAFPDSLNMMYFSKEFIINYPEKIKELDESFTRELFLYLIFQSEYDFIILDMQLQHIENEAMYQALFLSEKIFLVTLPDVSYVGYATFHINEWAKKSILLNNRLEIVVNRYEKSKLTPAHLQDWLETDRLITFPNVTKEMIEANYIGVPLSLLGKNNALKDALSQIINQLK